uniref:Uncharacterized protein n=1 Tax=Rhodopseudomonas palustris (strain BisA53) TaxID=316055 RepID=Q07TJ9_RHOP5
MARSGRVNVAQNGTLMMDVAGFQDLLDRLGEDLSSWPAQPRLDAELLLRSSEQARAALADAQNLRQRLAPPQVTAPPGLIDRIMQRARTVATDVSPSPTPSAERPRAPDSDQS